MPWKPYGPTFHVTPVDLCIIFQCNLYISCIVSFGNKIVSKLFQIVSIFVYKCVLVGHYFKLLAITTCPTKNDYTQQQTEIFC